VVAGYFVQDAGSIPAASTIFYAGEMTFWLIHCQITDQPGPAGARTSRPMPQREKTPTLPIRVKVGHALIKIYRTESNGCDQFVVTHYVGFKRLRKVRAE